MHPLRHVVPFGTAASGATDLRPYACVAGLAVAGVNARNGTVVFTGADNNDPGQWNEVYARDVSASDVCRVYVGPVGPETVWSFSNGAANGGITGLVVPKAKTMAWRMSYGNYGDRLTPKVYAEGAAVLCTILFTASDDGGDVPKLYGRRPLVRADDSPGHNLLYVNWLPRGFRGQAGGLRALSGAYTHALTAVFQ